MKMIAAIVAGIALSAGIASADDCTTCTVRWHGHSLDTGMSERAVLKITGKPSSRSNLINGFGAKLGELWEYDVPGYNKRTVLIQFHDGIVLRLTQCLGEDADSCTLAVNGGDD